MKRFSTSKVFLIRFVTILAVSVVTSSNLFGQQLQVQLTPQVKQGGYHISCSGLKINNNWKRIIFSMLFVVFSAVQGTAQTAAHDSVINGNLQFYADLDKSEMESDYLFNKGFIVLEDMEKWYSGIPIMSKPWKWRYIYEAVSSSCLSNCLGFPAYDSLISFNKIDRFGTTTISLACLNIKGDYITQSNIIEHASTNEDIEFESFTLFSGSALHSKSYSSNVEFYWDSKNYFSNLNGTESLSINFGNEAEWHVLPLNNYEVFYVSYSCIGDKNIIFRLINGIDTTYSYSSITVLQNEPIIPTVVDTITVLVDDSTNNSQSRMVIPGFGDILSMGEYLYFQGYDGKLDKPVIFIEGFDIAGNQNSFTMGSSLHLDSLRRNGYDVFYLSFIFSDKSLLENCLVVKELIKYINDNKVDHFEGVLYGESMGGILGRIALKQLENEGYDHQIGLFVANDSPMKGANIPLGLQWMINDILLSFGYHMVFNTAFVELVESIFNTDIILFDILDQLASPAARQMIIRHYMGNSDYIFMQAYLDSLGYPENCRNVCASSGGENIPENVIPAFPDQDMLNTPPINAGIFMVDFYCRYSGVNQNDYLVSQVAYWNIFPPNFINYIRRREDFNFQKFDSSPGGYIDAMNDNIKFCFVPTSSSIGLETSIFNSAQGLELFNRNNENELISEGSIPFDDVYLNRINNYHVGGFHKTQELDLMEIMYNKMYIQNRNISGHKDFEASDLIELGNNLKIQFHILPTPPVPAPFDFEDFIYEPYKTIKQSDFSVVNGGVVRVTAGKEIFLNPGTDLQLGSEVTMITAPPDPNINRLSSTCTPHSLTPSFLNCFLQLSTNSDFDDSKIEYVLFNPDGKEIVGSLDNHYFSIPEGQYTLMYSAEGCQSKKTEIIVNERNCSINKDKRNLTNQTNLIIYPNPCTENFSVRSYPNGVGSVIGFHYKISSLSGQVLIDSYAYSNIIDVNFLSSGVYILTIESDDAIYFSKLVKI